MPICSFALFSSLRARILHGLELLPAGQQRPPGVPLNQTNSRRRYKNSFSFCRLLLHLPFAHPRISRRSPKHRPGRPRELAHTGIQAHKHTTYKKRAPQAPQAPQAPTPSQWTLLCASSCDTLFIPLKSPFVNGSGVRKCYKVKTGARCDRIKVGEAFANRGTWL